MPEQLLVTAIQSTCTKIYKDSSRVCWVSQSSALPRGIDFSGQLYSAIIPSTKIQWRITVWFCASVRDLISANYLL